MRQTRAEALAWCKERALAELDHSGRPMDALTSFASDCQKHPETSSLLDVVQHLGMPLLMTGEIDNAASMRKFIEDFN